MPKKKSCGQRISVVFGDTLFFRQLKRNAKREMTISTRERRQLQRRGTARTAAIPWERGRRSHDARVYVGHSRIYSLNS